MSRRPVELFGFAAAERLGSSASRSSQRRDIDDALFQRGAVAGQVDAFGIEAFELVGDGAALARQKAGADAESLFPQAQVHARGLKLRLLYPLHGLDQPSRLHRLQFLAGKEPKGGKKARVVRNLGVGKQASGRSDCRAKS